MGDPDERDNSGGGADDAAGGDDGEEQADLREDVSTVEAEVDDLREAVAAVEREMETRTVHREEIERDLRRYVRARVRRGHARGWGPYLVLLYGTVMTIAAFSMLSGGWAILAMIVVWLSTLGLYTLMVLVGVGATAISAPGRALDAARTLIDTLRKLRP